VRVRVDDTDDKHGTDHDDLGAGANDDGHHHEDAAIYAVTTVERR